MRKRCLNADPRAYTAVGASAPYSLGGTPGLNEAAALREWTCPVAGTHFQRHIPPRHGGFGPRMPDLTVFRPLALLHLFLVRW
jgi:hypothetical protein